MHEKLHLKACSESQVCSTPEPQEQFFLVIMQYPLSPLEKQGHMGTKYVTELFLITLLLLFYV